MIVLGVTGSIGMGKSTVTRQFAALGARTISADTIVHKLLAKRGKAVRAVAKVFPEVVKNGAVDRKALGKIVFADKKRLAKLEAILHPMVVTEEERFVARHKSKGVKIVVLDIPLLFETGAERRMDRVVVVTAPPSIQRQRVLKRPHMTEEKFKRILKSQMPDIEKRKRADYVVETGQGKAHSFKRVKEIMSEIHAS